MIKKAFSFRRFGLKLALLALFALPELAGAQTYPPSFNYNSYGDVMAGFRRSGSYDTTGYQVVADLGSITNFLNVPAGTTINITNFTPGQLTDAFNNNDYLHWSVFSTFPFPSRNATWVTPLGTFPGGTIWYTLPGTNVNNQTQPPPREASGMQGNQVTEMNGVGDGAVTISGNSPESVDNTNTEVRESETYSAYILSAHIADFITPSNGDFGANDAPLPNDTDVENNTGPTFPAAERDDFYQVCPSDKVDPITGLSGANSYYVGYFILNPNGTMTFTRAAALPSPSTITASVTNGFGPLTVVFTNTASSGGVTNWVWNFGNGTSITNTTSGNVTNTYAVAGSYTVTLTVYGTGGSSTDTVANFIVASARPVINLAASIPQLVFSGANCPVGVQYRILTSTNLLTALANWKPVYTNKFASNGTFSYTNTIGGTNSFFIMVSP
jgi:PKD repeat protein